MNHLPEKSNTMISEGYRKLNEELHQSKPSYGAGGHADVKMVKQLIGEHRPKSILDYGCGKATLSKSLGWFHPPVHNYDPAIPEYAREPYPGDLVVCTDVLEHIEPAYLEAVLNDLRNLTRKAIYLSIATRPAKKFLSDGRNAHLIIEKPEWWLPKLRERFNIVKYWGHEGDLWVVGTLK